MCFDRDNEDSMITWWGDGRDNERQVSEALSNEVWGGESEPALSAGWRR